MFKAVLPFFFILAGVILCLNRNYPDGYMSTPSYPRQTMNAHFATITMIKGIEDKIKQRPLNQFYMTALGVILLLAGIVLAIVFYFI